MSGRGKKKEISPEDMVKAEELALLNLKNKTICDRLGWAKNFIEQRPDIRDRLTKKRAEHQEMVTRQQMELLHKGNSVMAVWLGKQIGQTDKQDLAIKASELPPIQVIIQPERKLEDNGRV